MTDYGFHTFLHEPLPFKAGKNVVLQVAATESAKYDVRNAYYANKLLSGALTYNEAQIRWFIHPFEIATKVGTRTRRRYPRLVKRFASVDGRKKCRFIGKLGMTDDSVQFFWNLTEPSSPAAGAGEACGGNP